MDISNYYCARNGHYIGLKVKNVLTYDFDDDKSTTHNSINFNVLIINLQ